MATTKSPILIYREFVSPLTCENIVDDLNFTFPDKDVNGKPIKTFKHNEDHELSLFKRLKTIVPHFEEHFEFSYRGTERMYFEHYATNCKIEPQCDNSSFVKKKWVRTRDRDISAVLFLSDYQDTPQFDTDYEVYGGKLEFPQHGFGLKPERGTLIVYPSAPHFINLFSPIFAGELNVVRIYMAAKMPYLYNPAKFPGDYTTWF